MVPVARKTNYSTPINYLENYYTETLTIYYKCMFPL